MEQRSGNEQLIAWLKKQLADLQGQGPWVDDAQRAREIKKLQETEHQQRREYETYLSSLSVE